MYMQNYKDILVYKTYRINLDNKLEAYNIFDNTKTYMRACKAIDEYLKTKEYEFSGNRIHRGMYKTKDGITFNADVNGALNILRKSSVVSLETLYGRGDVDTPIRIRVA